MVDTTPRDRSALLSDGPAIARALQAEPLYDYDDLRGFLARAEQLGQLKRLDAAHWDLEIGGLTEIEALRKGPALLFDRVPGYPAGFRVASNLFSTLQRSALVLRLPVDLGGVALLDLWRQRYRQIDLVPPVEVRTGPLFENAQEGAAVDLYRFPAPRWHELDGGRYLGTGCAVITRDPDDGTVNLGTYRCMIHNARQIGAKLNKGKHGRIHMEKWHARGEPCPIAISIGHDPTLWMASTFVAQVPEYELAGWVRGRPLDVVRGPRTGLPLPASAEIVLEGEIPLPDQMARLPEGPFGEWLGYYADTTDGIVPVVNVHAVYHRDDPIILGAPPMKPPAPYYFALPIRAAAVWDALEKAGIPDVRGVWPYSGPWNLFLVIAITQRYAGHARQAALVATGSRPGAYGGRFTVVVDDDVDITSPEEVMWAMATRCRVDQNLDVVRGVWTTPGDPLLPADARDHEENVSARALIDACLPYGQRDSFAPVNAISPALRQQLTAKWGLE